MGIHPPLVAGQLRQPAPALARPVQRPHHHRPPDPAAADVRPHADRLDRHAFGGAPAERRRERQLARPHHHAVPLGHDELVARVGVDRLERRPESRVRVLRHHAVPRPAHLVVVQQGDDRRHVRPGRRPEGDHRAGHRRPWLGTVRSIRYASTALTMQRVLGYAVWPSPSQVSTCPVPSIEARSAVFSYGVAGSPVVPTTTIGGAPAAAPAGYGSRLPGQRAHGIMPSASGAPNSGYFLRHSLCSRRIRSRLGTPVASVQFTARLASNRLEYVPPGRRSAYWSASAKMPLASPLCSPSTASASCRHPDSVYSDEITATKIQPVVAARPSAPRTGEAFALAMAS